MLVYRCFCRNNIDTGIIFQNHNSCARDAQQQKQGDKEQPVVKECIRAGLKEHSSYIAGILLFSNDFDKPLKMFCGFSVRQE